MGVYMGELPAGLDVLCVLNEGFWLFYLADSVYEKRREEHGKAVFAILVLGYVLLSGVFRRGVSDVPYLIPALILCTVSVALYWKCNAVNAFAVSGGYLFAYALFGEMEELLFYWVRQGRLLRGTEGIARGRMICGAAGAVVWLVLNAAFAWWRSRHKRPRAWHRDAVMALGVCTASFFAVVFTFNLLQALSDGGNLGWYLFLMLLVGLILWGYYYEKRRQMQDRLRILDMQNGMLERNYKRVSAFYAENAKLYHDMNHHLDAVGRMLEKGQEGEALAYIESLREPLRASKIPAYTGIDIIDTLLYEAGQQAAGRGILMELKLQPLPQDIAVEKKDLCALFGNLLDNAVEAAQRKITLSVKRVHGMIIIEMENDYEKKPKVEAGRFVSSKGEDSRHGWGTQIVRQIVKKYDGSIAYQAGERFRVEVMLNG